MPPPFRLPSVARAHLESLFPKLANSSWAIKSPPNDSYQCIAWAAGHTDRRWWPLLAPEYYWPPNAPPDDSIDGFVQTFTALGYSQCENADFELGYQKVAIYAGIDGVRHMARQEFFGRGWLSKLGDLEDIVHLDLASIEGSPSLGSPEYGTVQGILKRSWFVALIRLCLFRCGWATLKFWFHRITHL